MYTKKVYLDDGVHSVVNEPFIMPVNDDAVYLLHDNATNITCFTGLNNTGVQVTDLTVSNDLNATWSQFLNFGAGARTTYVGLTLYKNYTSSGDMVDASMINSIEAELERHENNDPHSANTGLPLQIDSTVPINNAVDIVNNSTVKFKANKYLKKNQPDKLKIYSDATRLNEVSGTVTQTDDDEYTWTPSTTFNPSSTYYPRVLSGVVGVDGVASLANYDFEFLIAANSAPTVPTGLASSALTSTGFHLAWIASTDPESNTPITYKVYKNGILTSSGITTLYYDVTGETPSTATWTVSAVDSLSNESAQSTGLSVTIPTNSAPTLSVAVTGTTTIGSTLTATTTVGTDPDGDTVSITTWRWLRNGVAISGATANTYVIVEADLGITLTAEATVTMNAGTNPSPTVNSGTVIPVPALTFAVTPGNMQNSLAITDAQPLSTDTATIYWSTVDTVATTIKANCPTTNTATAGKITGSLTSPVVHTTYDQTGQTGGTAALTNGSTYYYTIERDINGVASALSAVVSGVPTVKTTTAQHAYWLDELSGTTVTDTGVNATKYNGTADIVAADASIIIGADGTGKARRFAGTDVINFINTVIPIGAKTIKFKFKKDASNLTASNFIVATSTGMSQNGMYIGIGTDGKLFAVSTNGGGVSNRFSLTSPSVVNNNVWRTVKITWDGTTNTNGVKLYVDDMVTPVIQGTATSTETVSQSDNLTMGAANTAKGLPYYGDLDEFEFYNSVV